MFTSHTGIFNLGCWINISGIDHKFPKVTQIVEVFFEIWKRFTARKTFLFEFLARVVQSSSPHWSHINSFGVKYTKFGVFETQVDKVSIH